MGGIQYCIGTLGLMFSIRWCTLVQPVGSLGLNFRYIFIWLFSQHTASTRYSFHLVCRTSQWECGGQMCMLCKFSGKCRQSWCVDTKQLDNVITCLHWPESYNSNSGPFIPHIFRLVNLYGYFQDGFEITNNKQTSAWLRYCKYMRP